MMTFTHTHKDLDGNVVVEIEHKIHSDNGLDDIMQEFRRFLLAVSYSTATVDKYIEAE